jgi:hypothetical protein
MNENEPSDYAPPTPDEVRDLLKRLGLTGAEAGALVDVKGRQIRRYTGGDAVMPYAVLYTLLHKATQASISPKNWRAELWFD